MAVRNFVKADVNVAVEIGNLGDESFQTGFDSVDSLPESPDGHLLMIEDNRPSDICFASLTDSVVKAPASTLGRLITIPGTSMFSVQPLKMGM